MKEHELTDEKRTKKRYDLLPRSFSGYWYISSLQSTSYACMHNEGRERERVQSHCIPWEPNTKESFLFCSMQSTKRKSPPSKGHLHSVGASIVQCLALKFKFWGGTWLSPILSFLKALPYSSV